jgi:hypothetical protein
MCLVVYDGIWAYRLRKYPWERPLSKYRKPFKPYIPRDSVRTTPQEARDRMPRTEAQTMAKVLNLKVRYEDDLRKIPATEVKKEHGRLIVYDGEKLVGEFSEDKVEHWSLDEAAKTASA